jgi:hypothetical protein
MRSLVCVALVACSGQQQAGPPTELDRMIDRGKVVLYDFELVRELDRSFDIATLTTRGGFLIELERDAKGWHGEMGSVPLARESHEDVRLTAHRIDGGWRFTGAFVVCTHLDVRVRADGMFDAACGKHIAIVVPTTSIFERWAAWERTAIDRIFAATPEITRDAQGWSYQGERLDQCTVFAKGCELALLVPACSLSGERTMFVAQGTIEVAPIQLRDRQMKCDHVIGGVP